MFWRTMLPPSSESKFTWYPPHYVVLYNNPENYEFHLNINLPPPPQSSKWPFSKKFPHQDSVCTARFEVFMAMMIWVMVLWAVMPCSDVVWYQCFRERILLTHHEDGGGKVLWNTGILTMKLHGFTATRPWLKSAHNISPIWATCLAHLSHIIPLCAVS